MLNGERHIHQSESQVFGSWSSEFGKNGNGNEHISMPWGSPATEHQYHFSEVWEDHKHIPKIDKPTIQRIYFTRPCLPFFLVEGFS